MISFIGTNCKISFIYVGFNCKRKKVGEKMSGNLCHHGGGGGRRLMAKTILNFHFDYYYYLTPSLRRIQVSSHLCILLQAFVVAGGMFLGKYWTAIDSVETFLPGATAWTYLASLPYKTKNAVFSIIGDRLTLTGGWNMAIMAPTSEVIYC